MSAARNRILANIRQSLKRDGPLPDSVATVLRDRLRDPLPNLVPAFTEDPVARFLRKTQAVHATVARVASLAGVSRAVARHVNEHDLAEQLVVAPDPALDGIAWSNRFQIERRAARGSDAISVTGAFAGIAETGTLMMLSAASHPTTLNFLPEDHIVVLQQSDIVAHLEDAWVRLRAARPEFPRTVNLITGPSKTADVEQTIQEGAHGPRRVHVIVVRDSVNSAG